MSKSAGLARESLSAAPLPGDPKPVVAWAQLGESLRLSAQGHRRKTDKLLHRLPFLGDGRFLAAAGDLLREVRRAWCRVAVNDTVPHIPNPVDTLVDLRHWCLFQLEVLDFIRNGLPWNEGFCRSKSGPEDVFTDRDVLDQTESLFFSSESTPWLRDRLIKMSWRRSPYAQYWPAEPLRCILRQAEIYLRRLPGQNWPERPPETVDEPAVRHFLGQLIDWCDRQTHPNGDKSPLERELMVQKKPRFDTERNELSWRGIIIKKYKNPANNQLDVLEAFEKAQWPYMIPDPFRNARKLNQTIKDLNRGMSSPLIRFMGDGSGEGVCWKAIAANDSTAH